MPVVVMAKHPTPGAVKTRLAASVGAEAAAALARAFLLDLAARLAAEQFLVWWACWPAAAPFHALLPGARLLAQRGADLGERMAHAAAEVAARSAGAPVMLLGADVPHVETAVLRAAARALGAGCDVAIGPSEDGGYYLLGLRRVHAELFADVPWGTAAVLEATLARCRTLGLRVATLAGAFDIDGPADLERLRALLEVGGPPLPRTRALLATLSRPSRCRRR